MVPLFVLPLAFLVIVSYGIIKITIALKRAISIARFAPSWSFQTHDSNSILYWIGPTWPGRLGDPHVEFKPYDKVNATALATVSLDLLQPTFWFSDAEAVRQIMDREDRFRKDMAAYDIVAFHGPNIVASEGAVWKRHRHAVRTAFSEKNYSLVWDEAGRTLDEWFNELQSSDQRQVRVNAVGAFNKVALNIIASAGFGQHFPWEVETTTSSTELPFSTSITDSIRFMLWRALTPRWAYALPIPKIARTNFAFAEMDRHVLDLIREESQAGSEKPSSRSIAPGSLIKSLLDANDESEGKTRLSDRELLSNIFVFLLAGHDNTAHALAFVMGILALYPDIHARVREEADRVWPDQAARENSTYRKDFLQLSYALAVFYETLRHFPTEPSLPRFADQDSTLPGRKRSTPGHTFDETYTVFVPKGTTVIANIYGLHMNTHYWGPTAPDFNPSRFLDPDWPKHAFAPFATGQRACIGRGFATAEAVRIIASVAQTWDVKCTEDMLRLPWEERKRRLLRWRQEITMVPLDIKLVFVRREGR